MPIQKYEWDTPGGFTNDGPADSQIRFPGSLFLSLFYVHIPGFAVQIGEIAGGRECPPFSLPGSGKVVLCNSHWRTPWEDRSRPIDPWREGPDDTGSRPWEPGVVASELSDDSCHRRLVGFFASRPAPRRGSDGSSLVPRREPS